MTTPQPLVLADSTGDNLDFRPGHEAGDVFVTAESPSEDVAVVVNLTHDQLRQVIAWGAHVLGISTSVLGPALGLPQPYTDEQPQQPAPEPLDLVDFDGDRIRFTRYAGRRFGVEVETAPPVDDGGFDLRVILELDHVRQLRDWCTLALGEQLEPGSDAPTSPARTFAFRSAGEPHEVTVALRSLADCAICDQNIPAGAFVVVHPVDGGPDRWAHESCARPDQPTRHPLNTDQAARS